LAGSRQVDFAGLHEVQPPGIGQSLPSQGQFGQDGHSGLFEVSVRFSFAGQESLFGFADFLAQQREHPEDGALPSSAAF
jgi:hypothetical protein